MKRASEFGVVIERKTGAVRRIFNPDHDWEFSGHHVGSDEFMLRVRKKDFGVSEKPNSMTLDHVARIKAAFEK